MNERRLQPEVMDDPDLDEALHRGALRGLARLNAWSRADAPIWHVLSPLLRQRPLRLLDIATGSGDVPLRLATRARAAGFHLHVAGCDRSDLAIHTASRRATQLDIDADFFTLDVIHDDLPRDYDVITCSLFIHHLTEPQAEHVLRAMADSAHTIIVTDLRRSTYGTCLAAIAGRLLTRSPVVHTDAVRSAHAALTISELRQVATAAGLEAADIEPIWPSRMRLLWQAPA